MTTPTMTHCDNKAVVTNAAGSSSLLNKKCLALAYHFCREHFAGSGMDMLRVRGDHIMYDAMTKDLGSKPFLDHINKVLSYP